MTTQNKANNSSAACLAWVQNSAACLAWVETGSAAKMQRPTVTLKLKNLETVCL